jgi:hypothetical protein
MYGILKSIFTGKSGEDYALNKLLAAGTWAVGQVSFLGVGFRLLRASATTISDWALFFQFGAVWEGAVIAGCITLMTLAPKSEGGLVGKKDPTDAT